MTAQCNNLYLIVKEQTAKLQAKDAELQETRAKLTQQLPNKNKQTLHLEPDEAKDDLAGKV